MREQIIANIAAQVAAHGWYGNLADWSASKVYLTAVGEKEALLYVTRSSKDENLVVLSGEYQSEGRNVLAADSALISATASEDEVWNLVEQCLARMETSIAQSYAVHLVRDLVLHKGDKHCSPDGARSELSDLKLNPVVAFAFVDSTGLRCISFRYPR